MTSDRPYRDAMPSRIARMRMAQAVARYLRMVHNGSERQVA